MPRLHVIVRGRVQGVFYRASAIEKARELRLTGWVRNRFDGGVEVVAEGGADELARMRAWCASGPAGALVRDIEEFDEPESAEFQSFGVRPEA